MTDLDKQATHIANLRGLIMRTLAAYAGRHDGVTDDHLLAALAACLCDALIIKEIPFDDDVVNTIRKTYELCEIQHAMTDKANNSVQ